MIRLLADYAMRAYLTLLVIVLLSALARMVT